MTVDYIDAENHRNHFITGSDSYDGIGSFDLGNLEFYLDINVSTDISLSTQLNWNGDSSPTLELSYLRFQNAFDSRNVVDVGKILNPFGTFIQRKHAQFNPLYGNPLVYDYRTNLRSDSYPTNEAELLALRGGLVRNFTHSRNSIIDGIPNLSNIDGMPLIDTQYPVGVMYYTRFKNVDYYLGITNNSFSNNSSVASSKHKNFFAKVAHQSNHRLKFGASVSAGSYLDSSVPFPNGYSSGDYLQKIVGLDLTYKNKDLRINSEVVFSAFESPRIAEDLSTLGYYIETQYYWTETSYGAIRFGGLEFNEITPAVGEEVKWDNDMNRFEIGVGYYFASDVLGKAFIQNTESSGTNIKDNIFGLQLNAVF